MEKEKLTPNVVAAPTLFVGVGGTGCKIIKKVADACHPDERENISFVFLDTNVNDLKEVMTGKGHEYGIQTSNTQTVGDYLRYDVDARRNWFPKSAVIYDKTVSEGAGQVRSISRLALNACIKVGRLENLYKAIDDLFRKDGKELKQALRVVFASTASGGTGSGILLPLSMVVRDYVANKYPNTAIVCRALIMLPETLDSVIKSNVERESQRRNAYATIKEINAFMMKGSGFLDVDEDLKRYSNIHIDISEQGTNERKSLALLPFDFCFLMDGQNSEDNTLVNKNQYVEQAALALYEQNIGPMMGDAFSVEDNIIKELSNPGNYGRNRFGGIGAGKIRYPYEDIVRYVAYDWAKDSIGGEGEAAKWSLYDNKFKLEEAKEIKEGKPASEVIRLKDSYVQSARSGEDPFSIDLQNNYLNEADELIRKYIISFERHVLNSVKDQSAIKSASSELGEDIETKDYEKDEEARNDISSDKDKLRSYEIAVRDNVTKTAKNCAESVFRDGGKTAIARKAGSKDYTLEYLFNTETRGVMHPNAIRFYLYALRTKFEEKITAAKHKATESLKTLDQFSQNPSDVGDKFDAGYTKNVSENSIDALCNAVKEDPSLKEKLDGHNKVFSTIKECFIEWNDAINDYRDAAAKLEAYTIGLSYLEDYCKKFEDFYATFPKKVRNMDIRQGEIVDALQFRNGDSIYNVCASKTILEELSKSTGKRRSAGGRLDSDLCAKIFDAVKQNAFFERDAQLSDSIEEDKRVDIFDEILLGFFVDAVDTECKKELDINIIEAIGNECRLRRRAEDAASGANNGIVTDKTTQEDRISYIKSIIEKGARLSAPSIQKLSNEEPRDITCVAYNSELVNMRTYRIGELFPNGTNAKAYPSVSKYELHYFNALYNLTPNKLAKFACKIDTETRVKNAGMYHKAYADYAKLIGPDSTKNASLSTHIDKRWDSIAVMPEIDFNYQEEQMTRIHQALIYGLLYGQITYGDLSRATKGKKVYKYEDSDERNVELIVSNGTLCDEFYEVLDALYINSSIVSDMDKIKAKRCEKDGYKHSNYEKTSFATCVKNFEMLNVHEGPASVFEIPIAYYNSLPNSQRFGGEIATLVQAVIKTFRDEVGRWEDDCDAKFILCNALCDQFRLMVDNYTKFKKVNYGMELDENPVIDVIYRKLKAVIEETPEPDDYESVLASVRDLVKKTKIQKKAPASAR